MEAREIVAVTNTDTKSENVYPNDRRYRIEVAEDFKKVWKSITLPDAVDLEREMKVFSLPSLYLYHYPLSLSLYLFSLALPNRCSIS